jgi:V/A-type H+-transporting ATPase subunit I
VFLIGHVLNFALNLIGCFVHTMRLQFLEFFGKWYRDGGKPFRPLNYNTKYVDIKED